MPTTVSINTLDFHVSRSGDGIEPIELDVVVTYVDGRVQQITATHTDDGQTYYPPDTVLTAATRDNLRDALVLAAEPIADEVLSELHSDATPG